MNVYLRNKCMVNDLNIGACNSSSCKMTKQRAREKHWDSVQLFSLVHVHSIARCCRLYQLTVSCICQHTNYFLCATVATVQKSNTQARKRSLQYYILMIYCECNL